MLHQFSMIFFAFIFLAKTSTRACAACRHLACTEFMREYEIAVPVIPVSLMMRDDARESSESGKRSSAAALCVCRALLCRAHHRIKPHGTGAPANNLCWYVLHDVYARVRWRVRRIRFAIDPPVLCGAVSWPISMTRCVTRKKMSEPFEMRIERAAPHHR